jgi:general secretion pathway protein N
VKRKIILISGLLFVFIVSVIVHLPASLAVQRLSLPQDVKINGVHGTLWQGHIQELLWRDQTLKHISWQVKPLQLLTGQFSADVDFGQSPVKSLQGKGEIRLGLSGISVRDFSVSFPAQMLLKQAKLPVPVDAGGALRLTVKDYRYSRPFCKQAEGNLTWTGAQISLLSQSVALDKMTAHLTCEDNRIQVHGKQDSSMLRSQYTVKLGSDEHYHIQGWTEPGGELPASLKKMIQNSLSADRDGRYAFRYQGQLSR